MSLRLSPSEDWAFVCNMVGHIPWMDLQGDGHAISRVSCHSNITGHRVSRKPGGGKQKLRASWMVQL